MRTGIVARALVVFTMLCGALFPAADPARAEAVKSVTLDNGLQVVLKEEHKAPVSTFMVWYRVGSRNEVTGLTGLSHLLEHMMFKGASLYGKGEYADTVARHGGTQNAFTSRDYTAYYMNWAPENLPQSVLMEADRMKNLLLDPEEFDLEREVVREERRLRIDDNPISATVEQLFATAYQAYPYRTPVIGWMSDLEGLTRDDALRYYRQYYGPDNATVVVVGDFDSDTLLEQIRRGFSKIPPVRDIPEVHTREPLQEGQRRVWLKREAQLPFVITGYPTPNWSDDDAYALEVLSRILFDGKRSRIYQRLIYNDRIAVDAGGSYDPLTIGTQLFYFYAVVARDHTAEEVEVAIAEEIGRLQQEPPEARELQRVKNQVEANYIMRLDSIYSQSMVLGEAVTVGAGADYIETFPERIRRVTAEDITRVAKKYLVTDRSTVAVLVPTPAPETAGTDGEGGS
ncbi:MAG: M16 family metallopeptidase [Leptospirillia bacterium]